MKKKTLKNDIDALLNIPAAERILFLKVAELKEIFKDEMSELRKIKREQEQEKRRKMLMVAKDEGKQIRSYTFELKKKPGEKWRLSWLRPEPPEGSTASDILPEKTIRKLGAYAMSALNTFTLASLRDMRHQHTQYFRFYLKAEDLIRGSLSETPAPTVESGVTPDNQKKGE